MDLDGVIFIDKEVGYTSFKTVERVRRKIHARKAGHSGTLDRAASGLLIVCINRGTAVQELLTAESKEYRAEIAFGVETDTLDRYGWVVKTGTVQSYTERQIEDVLQHFKGKRLQIPPAFSAIHQNGKRMYRRALEGESVSIAPREIEIKAITLLKNERGSITIEVCASKGTYIRSLARDIASKLGTCGHLSALRRTRIGPFSVDRALRLDEITASTPVIPLNEALQHLQCIEVDEKSAPLVLNGMPMLRVMGNAIDRVRRSLDIEQGEDVEPYGNRCIRVTCEGKLLAIVRGDESFSYVKVLRDPNRKICSE